MPRRLPPNAYAVQIPAAGRLKRDTVNPFGTRRLKAWTLPPGGTEAGLRAARLQHDTAQSLRDAIQKSEHGSVAEFSRTCPDLTYERLRAILSGDAWMRLEDIAIMTTHLGLAAEFHFKSQ